jgi:hypothetical protein
MPQTCPHCSRPNPHEAVYCYFDGILLRRGGSAPANGATVNVATRPFATPFVFPSGTPCRNFEELAVACHANPAAALDLIQKGWLETFFSGQGRADLARAAREAARSANRERGLDDLLGKLPGNILQPAKLWLSPAEVDLGVMRIGQDRRVELRLHNGGQRLLYGTASTDFGWLALGDSPGVAQKLFQLSKEGVMAVQVRGRHLRAYHKPQTTAIVFESNGGTVTVPVRVQVPIQPFPEGVLAGVLTPRQLAERAKAAPKEAAVLIENGSVARWYEANGWKYPVGGPAATGIGAVQQLFEALGLVRAPKVDISANSLELEGAPGERVEHVLAVVTEERRAVVAHGVSDQAWLHVGKTICRGRTAMIPVTVPAVPHEPGVSLRCRVSVTANGNQRFEVPVSLAIRDDPQGFEVAPVETLPVAAAAVPTVPAYPAAIPAAEGGGQAPPPLVAYPDRHPLWLRLLPIVLLILGLSGVAFRDRLVRNDRPENPVTTPSSKAAP